MAVSWLWSGRQGPTAAQVVSKLTQSATSCRLAVSTASDMSSPSFGPAATPNSNNYVKMNVSGLTPSTLYYYQVEIDSVLDTAKTGQFRTFPVADNPANITFAFASCNESDSNHAVFDKIAPKNPLFFAHLGDKHYANISTDSEAPFRTQHDSNMAAAKQNDFHRLVPVDWIWDDHDFGPNGSNRLSPSKRASAAVYREIVPHYDLVDSMAAIYHTFDVGLVRFIMSDLRYYRHPGANTDCSTKSMMGREQKDWFKEVIADAVTSGIRTIVWGNPSQWSIDEPTIGIDPTDSWAAYTYERMELSLFMKDVGCPPVIVISGDAHESAARLNYVVGGMQFFVCQSAALDKTSNTRGGLWDYGPVGGGGHYSTLTITDDGDETLTAGLTAYSVTSGGVESTLFSPTVDLHPRLILPANKGTHHGRRRVGGVTE